MKGVDYLKKRLWKDVIGQEGENGMFEREIFENLKKAVIEYDADGAEFWAKRSIDGGFDPIQAVDVLSEAIREVGDGFGRGELFIPDLIGGAEAMKSAMRILEGEIERRGEKMRSSGTVVAGTVHGDIHDIGKTLVCTLLTAAGFTVHDLGVDVPAEEFVRAVREYRPDILAMSALLTTTAPELKKVIEALKEEKLMGKTKIIVGGAPINREFAKDIGADGYSPTAIGATGLVRRLLSQEGER